MREYTKQDVPYLNYLLYKEEGDFRLAEAFLRIPKTTIFILSPYSLVLLEDHKEEQAKIHIVVGEEDRGKQGIELGKQAIQQYFRDYPNTKKLVAYVPRDNRKCRMFALLTGWKKKGEEVIMNIQMDLYEVEVDQCHS